MARPREHSAEELRELALSAAGRLLDEQGIEALSARRIAAAIGYSAATLYSVFRNLDDLCWHLNAQTLGQLHAALGAVGGSEPRAQLHAYAAAYVAFARAQPQRWSLLFEHRTSPGVDIPDWLGASIERLFERVEAPLRALAPAASEADIRLQARTLWGSVHGLAVLQQRGKLFLSGDQASLRMLPTLVDQYLDGWLSARGELR
ncbi:hypothetical protein GCM10011348_13680 [Marinobacterium nitratireducens]|uniref:HTH tetR-type domain-containing protein n=1 Tax=Marinobacterium nitratireducens TaxID=518897 RepID=A0A917ZCY4_9GAMM|nr:TetR/AcrR family transcriptional regulator [Marinobacterium nitratireducens]GGO79432.1 hypothetical protein GCM10011348_13680 [Marinobacterium nitratireducens]